MKPPLNLLALAGALTVYSAAPCSSIPPQMQRSTHEQGTCDSLLQAAQYFAALQACGAEWEESRSAEAAIRAAAAAFSLRDSALFDLWFERLRGTAREARAWLFRGLLLRQTEAKASGERNAYLRGLEAAGSNDVEAAELLAMLCHLDWEKARYREALEWGKEGLTRAQRSGDSKTYGTQDRLHQNLFAVLHAVGDYRGAEEQLRARAALPQVTAWNRVHALFNQAVVLLDQEQPERALEVLLEAEETAAEEALALPAGTLRGVKLNYVEAHLLLGQLPQARSRLQEAHRHADPEDLNFEALAEFSSRLLYASGSYEDAAMIAGQALKRGASAPWVPKLALAEGRALMSLGKTSRARRSFRRAAHAVESLQSDVSYDWYKLWLAEKHREPYEHLFRLSVRRSDRAALHLFEEVKARTFLDALVKDHGQELEAEELIDLRDTIGRIQIQTSASPISRPMVHQEILSSVDGYLAVAYFESGAEVWRLVIDEGKLAWTQLPVTRIALTEQVEAFLSNLESGNASDQLAHSLLGGLETQGRRILVVPDGVTTRVPFAALKRQGRFLIEESQLLVSPSLSTWAHSSTRWIPKTDPPVVVGDPIGDLPAAEQEALQTARRLGVEPLTGANATREAILTVRQSRLAHLATHSGQSVHGPWIQLADGRFGMSEILKYGLAPGVVVLASCASAEELGRGVWSSLGAAFLAAGSRTVVSTLWAVDDRRTAKFVDHLYQDRGSVAASVASAQRAAIRAGVPVRSWAPFVVLGTDSALPDTGPGHVFPFSENNNGRTPE